MTLIDTADSRFAKAIALADHAGQWLKCRTAEGRKAYGIRSSRDANHVYFVTQTTCDCEDTKRHPALVCKHRIAVLVHVARVAGTPMPAGDTIDGLAEMVAERHPVLEMIREEDGSIRWERSHQHPAPKTVRLANQYDRIVGRFYDETPEQLMGRL